MNVITDRELNGKQMIFYISEAKFSSIDSVRIYIGNTAYDMKLSSSSKGRKCVLENADVQPGDCIVVVICEGQEPIYRSRKMRAKEFFTNVHQYDQQLLNINDMVFTNKEIAKNAVKYCFQ